MVLVKLPSAFETIVQLHSIEIFAGLSVPAIEALANDCVIEHFAKNDTIVFADENSTDMYCVLSGSVRVLNYSLSGREIVYDDILAGGIFGEICAIDGLGRSAHVVAIEPLVVARFCRDVFLETMEKYSQASIALAQHLVTIIRAAGRRIIDTSTKSSRIRLLTVMASMIADNPPQDANQVLVPNFPTHRALAGRVGCTRETILRGCCSLWLKKG